jgi:hypothetical protein
MAGIIANVDGDIQRLRQLKAEINNVKKTLATIDVNVKIDIKEELQKKLEGLTSEYTKLGEKVSQTEAIINHSAEKMLKSVDTITKAQQKLAQSVKSMPQGETKQQRENTTPHVSDNTETIHQQSKAYDDLKAQIDGVIGTRMQNVQRMTEEMNAIRLLNEEIKKINKSTQYGGELSTTQQRRLVMLNDSLLEHKAALADVRQGLNNNLKLDIAAATSMNEMSQSLSRMRIAYRELSEQERNSPFGKELLASIQQADVKIKELDSSIGNNQRNVGNYKSGFNGLNMSVQQVVRELPSATLGLNMFFLAISNNIPIMADEIKRAKIANDALKASGESTIPVWKQLTSALFSWQTAMMVGITLLTVYGKDIQTWISGLFSATNAIDALKFKQNELHLANMQGQKDAITEQTKLKILYSLSQDHKQSIKDRTLAVKEMQKEYPRYFGNLSTEAILAGQASVKYKQLTADILNAAKARAYEKRIEDIETKKIDIQRSINADTNWVNRNKQKKETFDSKVSNIGANDYVSASLTLKNTDPVIGEWDKRTKALKDNNKTMDAYNKAQDALAKEAVKNEISILNIEKPSKTKTKKTPDRTNMVTGAEDRLDSQEEKTANLRAKLAKEEEDRVEKARIDAMAEGAEKTKAQRDYDNKKELEDIEKRKNEYIRQITESEKTKFNAEENLKAANNKKYHKQSWNSSSTKADLNIDTSAFDIERKNVLSSQTVKENQDNQASLRDFLKEYGTMEEQKLAITKEYELKISDAMALGNVGQAESLKMKLDEELKSASFADLKDLINWDDLFENLSRKSPKYLEELRNNLRNILKSGNLNIDDMKVVSDKIHDIDDAISATKSNWGLSNEKIREHKRLVAEAADAAERLQVAEGKLGEAKAQQGLAQTSIAGVMKGAGVKVNASDIKFSDKDNFINKLGLDKNSTQVQKLKDAFDKLFDAESQVTKSTKDVTKAQGEAKSTKDNAKVSAKDVAESVETSLSKAYDKVKDLPDLMNTLGMGDTKIGKSVSAGVNAISSGQNAAADFASGNYIGAANNAIKTVTSVGEMIGITGADYSSLNTQLEHSKEVISVWDEQLQDSMKTLQSAIGSEVLSAGEKSLSLVEMELSQVRSNAYSVLGSGSSAGSHSIGERMWNGNYGDWSGNAQNMVSGIKKAGLGDVSFNGMDDLVKMNGSQLEWIRDNYTDLWVNLDSNFRDQLNNIITYGKKEGDIMDEMKEKITGMSFDSFLDGFESMLDDMSSDVNDFTDDFSNKMMKAIINDEIVSKYKSQLKSLYDSWYSDATDKKSDGGAKITTSESQALKSSAKTIAENALADRDYYAQIFGWDTTSAKTATKATSVSASQDSVDEANGRMTAIEEILIENKGISELSESELKTLNVQAVVISSDVAGIREKLSDSYDELKGIHRDTTDIAGYIKPIKSYSDDMKEIKDILKKGLGK